MEIGRNAEKDAALLSLDIREAGDRVIEALARERQRLLDLLIRTERSHDPERSHDGGGTWENGMADEPIDTWTQSNFKTEMDQLRDLTRQLQAVKDKLSELTITMPIASDMRTNAFVLPPRQFSPAFWDNDVSETPIPLLAGR